MEEKLYNVDYYKQVDRDIIYAVLREDDGYAFYYLPENKKWEFSVIDFNMLQKDFDYIKLEKADALKFANNKSVENLFTKMFGFKIYND